MLNRYVIVINFISDFCNLFWNYIISVDFSKISIDLIIFPVVSRNDLASFRTDFTHCFVVFIVDIEKANSGWDSFLLFF